MLEEIHLHTRRCDIMSHLNAVVSFATPVYKVGLVLIASSWPLQVNCLGRSCLFGNTRLLKAEIMNMRPA